MDTNTLQPIAARSTTFSGTRPDPTTTALALACVVVVALTAAAQTRQGGGRVTPDGAFDTVWIVDRGMPEFELWRTLTHVTSSEGFQPVVLHSGRDWRWTQSLVHLVQLLPQGDSVWVSETKTMFDVDRWESPAGVALLDPSNGPAVYSADASFDPVAALIAMRLDGVLTAEMPATGAPSVFVGIDGPRIQAENSDVYLPTREDAVAYANQLARREVVMVAPSEELLPEYVLWAFQRDAKILEVDPPPYDIYDAWSEFVAVDEVARQIRAGLQGLLGGDLPEALVIAGDWYEIPFRFPYGLGSAGATSLPVFPPFRCDSCDNGMYEYAADLVYANLAGDFSSGPDVPIGRLMSPFQDLLAIQTVLGIWSEHGAFAAPTDGVFLGLLGTNVPSHRWTMFEAWREAFTDLIWSSFGPERAGSNFRLDRDAFFHVADRSEIVVAHGHGHPDFLSPNGSLFNQAISGNHLRDRAGDGNPAFWFLHACGTGKPDKNDHFAEETLLVGLQSRLAFGSLMAVENIAGGSSDPYWWIESAESGLTVGELVRRFAAAGTTAYRDGDAVAPGLPRTNGSPENKTANGLGAMYWIGDPLTVVGSVY